MMRIRGRFIAHYQASPEAFTKGSPYVHTYMLQLHPGSLISDGEEISSYPIPTGFQKGQLYFDKVEQVKIFFRPELDKKPCLEDLQKVVITNATINEVGRRGNLVYGTITGTIHGSIGELVESQVNESAPLEHKPETVINEPLSFSTSPISESLPTSISEPAKSISPKWGILKRIISWLALLAALWGIVELLSNSHFNCNAPKPDVPEPVYEDSVSTNFDDSIFVKGNGISLSVYDWDKIDGDAVGLVFNSDTLTNSLTLKKEPQTWYLNELKNGSNDLLVFATSQGRSGASTPTFEVNDGKNVQIFRVNCEIGHPLHVLIYSEPKK